MINRCCKLSLRSLISSKLRRSTTPRSSNNSCAILRICQRNTIWKNSLSWADSVFGPCLFVTEYKHSERGCQALNAPLRLVWPVVSRLKRVFNVLDRHWNHTLPWCTPIAFCDFRIAERQSPNQVRKSVFLPHLTSLPFGQQQGIKIN